MPSILPSQYKHLESLYELHSFNFGIYTITPVCTGFISTCRHKRWEEPEAVFVWLLQSKNDTILIDTGLSNEVNNVHYFPSFLNFFFRRKYKFYLRPKETSMPININSIKTVLLTHAHFDHTGMLPFFTHSKIFISKNEFQAASGKWNFIKGYTPGTLPSSLQYVKYARESADEDNVILHTIDEICPGLFVVPTYQHTRGHLAFILRQADRYICFAGDEGDNIVHNGKLNKIEKKIMDFTLQNVTLVLNNHDNNAIDKLDKWISALLET